MRIYTMQDWRSDGTLKLTVGQLVDKNVVSELVNSVPPITYKMGIVQIGEAYSHNDIGRPLYMTFTSVNGGWLYEGLREEL